MSVRIASILLATLPVLALLQGAAQADDDDDQPPLPTYAPPYQGPAQAQPVYQAPLSQTTQTTYVPQSVALSGPEEIDDVEGRRAPAGYTPVQRTRKGMLIGGGITFGVSYGYAVLFAAAGSDSASYDNYDGSSGKNELAALWIPVAGPFIQLADTDSSIGKLALAGLGSAQVIGAVMLYYGLTTKKTVYVRNDLLGSLQMTPMVGANGGNGMAVTGRF
jgi:hypothetical protein